MSDEQPGQDLVTIRNGKAVEASLRYGPAMDHLTRKQQAFVLALCEDPRDNATAACMAAGYTTNRESAKVLGSRLRRDPKILAAVHECAVANLHGLKLLATHTVRQVLEDPTTRARDRLSAAAMVFNRAGMSEETTQNVVVEDKRPGQAAEVITAIKELAKQLGIDARPLLATAGVIEAEFTEVPAASTTGLEDVL